MDKYAKAIVGMILAILGSLQVAMADGSVTGTEWVTIAIAAVVVLGGVWGVTNAPKDESK